MKQLNCTMRGPVFRTPISPGNSRGGSGYVVPVCSYTPRGGGGAARGGGQAAVVHHYCCLFGDPHLLGFNNTQHTCRIVGAWPLLNNEYLSVQATSESVGFGGGSAINKVGEYGI